MASFASQPLVLTDLEYWQDLSLSEEKFFRSAANAAWSSQQLLGPEETNRWSKLNFAPRCEDWGILGN